MAQIAAQPPAPSVNLRILALSRALGASRPGCRPTSEIPNGQQLPGDHAIYAWNRAELSDLTLKSVPALIDHDPPHVGRFANTCGSQSLTHCSSAAQHNFNRMLRDATKKKSGPGIPSWKLSTHSAKDCQIESGKSFAGLQQRSLV